MTDVDPTTPLTPAELALVRKINETMTREQVLEELRAHLQTAAEIELATIPIYLYTYYSLVRHINSGPELTEADLFANRAGSIIMSVAVEEMLHMTLVSNVIYALTGNPAQLYRKAPANYPTPLPYHNPNGPVGPHGGSQVKIPLGKFSFDQLWHFLQIEYPEAADSPPEGNDWDTIGQFYSYIRCLIASDRVTDADFQAGPVQQQIQPGNYSPNSIDTAYPKQRFDTWKVPPRQDGGPVASYGKSPSAAEVTSYANAPDSHAGPEELITVSSKLDALNAIDTICDQGEGRATPEGPEPTDDPSKSEDSHYFKFLSLQSQLAPYAASSEQLPKVPAPPPPVEPGWTQKQLEAQGIVVNLPANPLTRAVGETTGRYIYPESLAPISDFLNGLFQYMLLCIETTYRVPPDQQKRFFNETLHQAMIWVMDGYCMTMRGIPLPDGHVMGPTFENIDLGEPAEAFGRLNDLGLAAIRAASTVPQAGSIPGYVAGTTGFNAKELKVAKSMPDVSRYWS